MIIYRAFQLLLLIAALGFGTACHEQSGPEPTLEPPAKTGFRVWDFIEPSRQRAIQAQLWYPVARNAPSILEESYFRRVNAALDAPIADPGHRYPLILLAHGQDGGPDSLAWLAEIFVVNGYIVAEVRGDPSSSDGALEDWNYALDISALLSSLLESDLSPSIDPKRIGLIGYSTGALAGIWLAGGQNRELEPENLMPTKEDADLDIFGNIGQHLAEANLQAWRASYRDPRIKAYLLLAPAWAWIFEEKDLKHIVADVMIIAGDYDEVVSTTRNAVRLAQWIPGAEFKELQGHVGHWEFMGFWTQQGFDKLRQTLPQSAWPSVPLEHRRRYVHDQVAELAVDFFNHHLENS